MATRRKSKATTGFAEIAVELIRSLPLQNGVDVDALANDLAHHLKLGSMRVYGDVTQKEISAQLKSLDKALNALTSAIDELCPEVFALLVAETISAGYSDPATPPRTPPHPATLQNAKAADLRNTLKFLSAVKDRVNILRSQKGKTGPANVLADRLGYSLARVYHDATGRAPAVKSGSGMGTFFRFVNSTLNAIKRNEESAENVTRNAVSHWKASESHTASHRQG